MMDVRYVIQLAETTRVSDHSIGYSEYFPRLSRGVYQEFTYISGILWRQQCLLCQKPVDKLKTRRFTKAANEMMTSANSFAIHIVEEAALDIKS